MQPVHSSAFHRPLYLRSLPAPGLILFLAVVHGGAILCIAISGLPIWLKSLLSLLALVLLLVSCRQAVERSAMQLIINARDDWFVILPSGQTATVHACSATILEPRLVLLIVRDDGARRYAFIISAWNTGPDSLRRLRVRLRYRLNRQDSPTRRIPG